MQHVLARTYLVYLNMSQNAYTWLIITLTEVSKFKDFSRSQAVT